MSLYQKDQNGNIKKLAGYLTQRVNARWFGCTRIEEGGVEYYDVPKEVEEYYKPFMSYLTYSFGFTEPNTTKTPKLRYGDKVLDIFDFTNEDGHVNVGQLLGVYQMFTKNVLNDTHMYFCGTSHRDSDVLNRLLPESGEDKTALIYDKNHAVYGKIDYDRLAQAVIDRLLPDASTGTEGQVVLLGADGKPVYKTVESGADKYITLNVPASAESGTLSEEDLTVLQSSKQNKIVFDNEIYSLQDNQHDRGYLIYTHVGHNSTNKFTIKCLTITINTRGWVLTARDVLNSAGDTMSGGLTVPFINSNPELPYNASGIVCVETLTTEGLSNSQDVNQAVDWLLTELKRRYPSNKPTNNLTFIGTLRSGWVGNYMVNLYQLDSKPSNLLPEYSSGIITVRGAAGEIESSFGTYIIGTESYNIYCQKLAEKNRVLSKSGGDLNGYLQIFGQLHAMEYNIDSNAPAIIFDKPGSYRTGIGSHNAYDTIWFGAVTEITSGKWGWKDDFFQNWAFNGNVTANNFKINNILQTRTEYTLSGIDLNTVKYSVLASVRSTCTNLPDTIDGYLICIKWDEGVNYCLQIYITERASLYIRTNLSATGDSWLDWHRFD